MYCYVYKGQHKEDHYLYLNQKFSAELLPSGLPEGLLGMLGELSLVLEFELTEDRKLPQADPVQVIDDILSQGFYLQIPKKDMLAVEDQYFN